MLSLLLAREAARTMEMPDVIARLGRAIQVSRGGAAGPPQPVTGLALADLLVRADAIVTREFTSEERRRFAPLLEPGP